METVAFIPQSRLSVDTIGGVPFLLSASVNLVLLLQKYINLMAFGLIVRVVVKCWAYFTLENYDFC